MSSEITKRPDRVETRVLLGIITVATLLRVATAWLTIDMPGDGPSRAILAYQWSQSPGFIGPGVWLPGFTYLAGALCMLIPDPRIAPRLINLVLGSASIPLLYAVTRRVYGSAIALTAAAVLAVLPLHVALSASSLTEASFVFAMLAAVWSALGAGEDRTSAPSLRLALVGLFGVFAESLRYEAWLLLPLVVAYVAYRRRSRRAGLGLTIVLLCFPVLWSLQNYVDSGETWIGFTRAVTDTESPQQVSWFVAIRLLWRILGNHVVGLVAALILVSGVAVAAVRLARRQASAEEVLLFGLVAVMWAILCAFAVQRGSTLWSRYLILGAVLALPLAIGSVARFVRGGRQRAAIAVACAASLILTCVRYPPDTYVTRSRPAEIERLIEWYKGSIYRDDAILITRMNWYATYVPMHSPDLSLRLFVVSDVARDEWIRDFVQTWQPALLVTQPGDASLRTRLEQLLGGTIGPQHLVTTVHQMQVFDIRRLTAKRVSEAGVDATGSDGVRVR